MLSNLILSVIIAGDSEVKLHATRSLKDEDWDSIAKTLCCTIIQIDKNDEVQVAETQYDIFNQPLVFKFDAKGTTVLYTRDVAKFAAESTLSD